MGRPIKDPLLLQQIRDNEARLGEAPLDGSRGEKITDPIILDQIRKAEGGATFGETAKDVAQQAGYGLVRGAVGLPNLLYEGADYLSGGRLPDLENSPLYQEMHTPSQTTAGRYTGAVAEGVGGLVPGAGAFAAAGKLATALRAPRVGSFLTGAAAQPFSPINVGAGATGGAAAQYAEDQGVGPGGQLAAGLAGGIAGGLGVAGARRAAPAVRGAFLPDPEAGALEFPGRRPPPIPGAAADPQVTEQAFQAIRDRMLQRGMTPQELADEIQTGAAAHQFHPTSQVPRAEMLADINETLGRFGASQVRHHPAAAAEARPALLARQTGVGEEGQFPGLTTYPPGDPRHFARTGIDAPPAGQIPRAVEGGRRILGIQDMKHHGFQGTAEQTAKAISASQEAAADVSYGVLRAAGQRVNLQNEPGVAAAIKSLQDRLAANPPGEEATLIRYALRQYAPGGRVHSNIDELDKAKRYVDEQIRKYFDRGDSGMNVERGRVLRDINRGIIRAVDDVQTENLGGLYGRARAEFAGPAETKNQIQLGYDIYHGKADTADYRALAGDRAAQKRVRLGFHGAFEEALGDQPITHDTIKKVFGSRNQQQRWHEMIGGGFVPEAPRRFAEFMKRLGRETDTQRLVHGGSPTAENLAVDQASNVLHTISDVFQGNLKAVGQQAFEFAMERMFGQRAEVSREISRILFSPDPVANARAVARLQMMLGRTRFQRLGEVMDELGRRVAEQQQRSLAGTAAGGLTAPWDDLGEAAAAY